VSWVYLTADGQSSSIGIGLPFIAHDQILSLSFFLVAIDFCSSCKAPSLTIGRVCNLQCNRWLVRSLRTNNHTLPSHLRLCFLFVASYDVVEVEVTLRPTGSRPVRLDVLPLWIKWPDVTFIWVTITFFIFHVGCPLWREDGSVICSAMTHVQFQVTLRPTVCRPSSSWCRAPSGRCRSRNRSRSQIMTDSQSSSQSWCQGPIWDPRPILLSPWNFLQIVACF
jgi:hypothetical protein